MSEHNTLVKLNVGCGGMNLPGYVNLDKFPHPHVDIIYDLECGLPMNFRDSKKPPELQYRTVPDNYFDRILISHTFEHVTNILAMMTELWRVAKPGCSCVIITPYGSSDNSDEDPTHVRRIFSNSYLYFSQAAYAKNSYGYTADWDYARRIFIIDEEYKNLRDEQLGRAVAVYRNVVVEFQAELTAVKPSREPGFEPKVPSTAYKFR